MTEYRVRDVAGRTRIEATAASLGTALAAVADGVVATYHGRSETTDDRRYDCAATAGDPLGLLVDYLDELDYQRDVRRVLPVDNDATVVRRGGRLRLSGTFSGGAADDDVGPVVRGALVDPRARQDGTDWSVGVGLEEPANDPVR